MNKRQRRERIRERRRVMQANYRWHVEWNRPLTPEEIEADHRLGPMLVLGGDIAGDRYIEMTRST